MVLVSWICVCVADFFISILISLGNTTIYSCSKPTLYRLQSSTLYAIEISWIAWCTDDMGTAERRVAKSPAYFKHGDYVLGLNVSLSLFSVLGYKHYNVTYTWNEIKLKDMNLI